MAHNVQLRSTRVIGIGLSGNFGRDRGEVCDY